jgi:hypothetical protein
MGTLEAETARMLAAAREIQAIADKLAIVTEPPDINWGDDSFGETMRAQYAKAPVADCRQTQQDLAKRINAIAGAVEKTAQEYLAQEQKNAGKVQNVKV